MQLYLTMRQRGQFPGLTDVTPEDMPLDVAMRSLDVVSNSKAPQVLLTGNETMLYPDLEDVLKGCRKRNVMPVIETNGLMPSYAKTLVKEFRCALLWRFFRPELYSAEELAEMQENLEDVFQSGLTVRMLLMLDKPAEDFHFILPYLEKYAFEAVQLRASCLLTQEEIAKAMGIHEEILKKNLGKRQTFLDCGVLPCAMTDAQFGCQQKHGGHLETCLPRPGVLPDGRIVHCQEMVHFPGRHVSSFKNEQDMQAYYYDINHDLMLSYALTPACKGCSCLVGRICNSLSIAWKAREIQKRYQECKAKLDAEDGTLDDMSRMNLLWETNQMCMLIGMYPEAMECLEEMRRQHPEKERIHYDLGICYWELGRFAEGEEEFRKCARIAKNPLNALLELQRRLAKNGNTFRARLLQGEIEKEMVRQRELQEQSKQG